MEQQRTEGWYQERLGIPTASSFNKLITSTGKPSSQAQTYINQLIAEAVTGNRPEQITTPAIERGIALESEAIEWYTLLTDRTVEETGFWRHPEIDCGASPDGLVGEGLLEVKCPINSTQVATLRKKTVPSQYVPQIQGQMWVLNKPWVDFLSYSNELPPFLVRVTRDEPYIAKLAEEVAKASAAVKAETSKLKEML